MKKCILVILILSGVVAARDPVDAQRAALRKKLTRLAKVRESLAAPQPQPALAVIAASDKAGSTDPLMAETKEEPAEPVAEQSAQVVAVEKLPTPIAKPGVASPANHPPAVAVGTSFAAANEVINSSTTDDFLEGNAKQEVSLGEIARRYRARKRQQETTEGLHAEN